MRRYLVKTLAWRIRHVSDRNFILLLAGVIGAISGLAAVALKQTVHYIHDLLIEGSLIRSNDLWYLSFPLAGVFITYWISKYIFKEAYGHGITNILYDISRRSSRMKPIQMISRMVTSAVTVGFGGSVGLEAPIVVTGSAIGSNVGQAMHLNYRQRTILIGCGSAAAIAGIFNSPIAGVIFAIEVILTEVAVATFIPILIAAVMGSLVSILLLGEDVLFSFKLIDSFRAGDVPFYLLLGILLGLFSVYFTRVTFRVEDVIKRVKKDSIRAIIGGLGIGLIIFIFPPIYGEGYETIKALLNGQEVLTIGNSLFGEEYSGVTITIIFLAGVLLIKPVASALTIGSGGSGGIFAPSLFVGGVAGFLFAYTSNNIFGTDLSITNFVLVGMCGTMSGVLHAPLTAIFLIAEITSGYTLFLPLMLVSAIAFNAASYFEKYSFYTKHLVAQGDIIHSDRDRQLLSLINMRKIIEKDLLTIHPNASLGELVKLVQQSKRNIFPVVDENNILKGVVTLDDIREIMFDDEARENVTVSSIMHSPPAYVSTHENMQSVMRKFEMTGAWNLPVIDEDEYVGFVSKSSIFNSYRTKLKRG